jgi:hypothetical protein
LPDESEVAIFVSLVKRHPPAMQTVAFLVLLLLLSSHALTASGHGLRRARCAENKVPDAQVPSAQHLDRLSSFYSDSANNVFPDPLIVPVVFHILRSADGSVGNVPMDSIVAQVETLNLAYSASRKGQWAPSVGSQTPFAGDIFIGFFLV